MPKAMPNHTAFNAGELSPLVAGRIDLQKWRYGLKRCRNFVPLVQGAVTRRPGTYFVSTTKSNGFAVLRRFVFSVDQAFILEFGDLYVRFYRNYGQVVSGMSAYEVATPYTEAQVEQLQFEQSADVLYITHPDHWPRKLSRLGNTNWTLTLYEPEGGPFQRVNTDRGVTVYASARDGTVTIRASSAIFSAGMVGEMFYIEQLSAQDIQPWDVNRKIGIGDQRRYDGRIYEAVARNNDEETGETAPTHTEGEEWDGSPDDGIKWKFIHAGFGWGRITAYTSPTQVTMSVVQTLPEVIGSNQATYKWAKAAWSATNGYPAAVALAFQRLCFAATAAQPDTVWMTETGLFDSMRTKNRGGMVTAAQAVTVTIAPTNGQVNRIRWMVADSRGLLVGSTGGEGLIKARAQNEGFGPNNADYDPQSGYGSADLAPVQANNAVLMVQRARKKLLELSYNFDKDRFVGPDLTILANHVTDAGAMRAPAWQQQPNAIIWMPTDDGRLLGFTYNRDEDVLGWHQHSLSGVVESAEVIPAPDGSGDDLWLIVRRTIEGQTRRHVEYMTAFWSSSMDAADAFYVDCGVSYEGAATTTLSGLGHLEGQEVAINANGATHPGRTVVGGAVSLDREVTKAHVGLPFVSEIELMPLEAGVPPGTTAQGQAMRIERLTMRFLDTIGGYFGVSRVKDRIETRVPADPMNEAVPMIGRDDNGIVSRPMPGGYDDGNTAIVGQDEPLPMTIVSLIPHLSVSPRL